MEFETVILRFRDLVTENNVTIARHKDMLRVNPLHLTLRMEVKPIPIRERLQDPL